MEDAFVYALEKIKKKTKPGNRAKLYVWKQRFYEGNMSYRKMAQILKTAGFFISVSQKWSKKKKKKR